MNETMTTTEIKQLVAEMRGIQDQLYDLRQGLDDDEVLDDLMDAVNCLEESIICEVI